MAVLASLGSRTGIFLVIFIYLFVRLWALLSQWLWTCKAHLSTEPGDKNWRSKHAYFAVFVLVLWWGRCLLCTLNGLRCNDPTYINGQSSKCFPLWMMRREGKWAALSFLLQKQCLWQFCWWCSPIPVAVQVLYFPSSPDQAFIPSFSLFLSRTFCPGRKRLVWGFLECCWLFRCPGHQTCSEKYYRA